MEIFDGLSEVLRECRENVALIVPMRRMECENLIETRNLISSSDAQLLYISKIPTHQHFKLTSVLRKFFIRVAYFQTT